MSSSVRLQCGAAAAVLLTSLASGAVPAASAQSLSPTVSVAAALPGSPSLSGSASASLAASIDQIAANPGVPVTVSETLTQLRAALQGGNPPSAAQVAALLERLAESPLLPASVAQALHALSQSLGGGVPSLSDLNGALEKLIGQVANAPGVPAGVRSTLTDLIGALGAGRPLGLAQVADLLRQAAQSPGVPTPVASVLYGLANAIAGPAGGAGANGAGGAPGGAANADARGGANGTNGAPGSAGTLGYFGSNPFRPGFNPAGPLASGRRDSAATRAGGITIKRVTYNARRRTVAVVVQCNARGRACNTAVAVYRGAARSGKPAAKTIAAQRRATFLLPLPKATAAVMAKRGGVLRAVAISKTPSGQSHSSMSLTIRRSRRR